MPEALPEFKPYLVSAIAANGAEVALVLLSSEGNLQLLASKGPLVVNLEARKEAISLAQYARVMQAAFDRDRHLSEGGVLQ